MFCPYYNRGLSSLSIVFMLFLLKHCHSVFFSLVFLLPSHYAQPCEFVFSLVLTCLKAGSLAVLHSSDFLDISDDGLHRARSSFIILHYRVLFFLHLASGSTCAGCHLQLLQVCLLSLRDCVLVNSLLASLAIPGFYSWMISYEGQ